MGVVVFKSKGTINGTPSWVYNPVRMVPVLITSSSTETTGTDLALHLPRGTLHETQGPSSNPSTTFSDSWTVT